MRSLLLLAVTSLASALVIPDEGMLAEMRSQGDRALEWDGRPDSHEGIAVDPWVVDDLKEWRSVDIGLSLGLADREHGDWGREEPSESHHHRHNHCHRHGDWPGKGRHHHRHGDCPEDHEHGDEPGEGHHNHHHHRHGEWPGNDECSHEGWPGNRDGEGRNNPHFQPPHNYPQPGHGEWRRPRIHPCPIHRPDICPGPQCHRDQTTWELIQRNQQTSRLAELIANDKDLIDLLRKKENHTVFAPTNQALDQLEHLPEKAMSSFLRYHIVPGRVHIDDLALHQTLPTKLTEGSLGKLPQRIIIDRTNEVILNERSTVLVADMTTKNGVVHIIDHSLLPPPDTRVMIPETSTFAQALAQTKLTHHMDPAKRSGGTTFVPTNEAFRRLGWRVNDFLFSKRGEDCLRSLIEYHIVVNQTLYSDVLYRDGKAKGLFSGSGHAVVEMTTVEGRKVHVDVEDVMLVNGVGGVIADLAARDGSVLVLERVLLPPHKLKNKYFGEEKEVEELAERLNCVHGQEYEL